MATVTIQPGSEGKDTYYGNSFAQTGSPDSDVLRIGGWGDEYFSFVEFDLSGIPSGALINSATLSFYCKLLPSANNVKLDRVTSSWTEAGVTHVAVPSSTAYASYQAITLNSWVAFDVTTLVANWKDGTWNNYGVKLDAEFNASNQTAEFWSSDYVTDPTLRPKLVVDYNPDGSTLEPVVHDSITVQDVRAVFHSAEGKLIDIEDTLTVSESVSMRLMSEGVQVFIGGNLMTRSIGLYSLTVENILTSQVDRCKMSIKKYGEQFTFVPEIGDEVFVYNDGNKIFGGLVVKVTQGAEDYKIINYEVECEDYTRLLDRKLVVQTYYNMSVREIIEDIARIYLPGFTTNNVIDADTVITSITFNYITASDCFKKIADLLNYDWYIDYDKDIHFFPDEEEDAPVVIQDDDGSYIFSSLVIRHDSSQIRNRVYIRGGEYLADTFTTEFVSNGIQNVYALPYRYDDLRVSVTGEIWEQGIDNVTPITEADYIWNSEEKFIRFRGDKIPSDTSVIRASGQPYLPVRVVLQDSDSITELATREGGDGVYEFLIIDDTIVSREQARDRANAELEAYKDTISEGSFRTYQDGLKAGQLIRINSDAHDIDETYIINKVVANVRGRDSLTYEVSVVTTKTFGIIEFLQELLTKDKKTLLIDTTEIVDLVYSHPENIAINETVTAHALNYQTQFVAGPYAPTGLKRVFFTNGSPLGPAGYVNKGSYVHIDDVVTVVRT